MQSIHISDDIQIVVQSSGNSGELESNPLQNDIEQFDVNKKKDSFASSKSDPQDNIVHSAEDSLTEPVTTSNPLSSTESITSARTESSEVLTAVVVDELIKSELSAPEISELPALTTAAAIEQLDMSEPQLLKEWMAPEPILVSESDYQLQITEKANEPTLDALSIGISEHEKMREELREIAKRIDPAESKSSEHSWVYQGITYNAFVSPQSATSDTELDQILVEVQTTKDGKKVQVKMQMKRLAFSNFSQITNEIEVSSRTNARDAISEDAKRLELSDGGLAPGIEKIGMPEFFIPFPDADSRENVVIHRLDTDVELEFISGGRVKIIDSNSGSYSFKEMNHRTQYFLATDGTNLRVRGIVDGKVLVYSPNNITISGDLTYASAAGNNTLFADDYLGLVSDHDLIIAGMKEIGDADLTVHAAIYARNKLIIEDYQSPTDAILSIFGSVTSGMLGSVQPRFKTQLVHDERMHNIRPPGFPMTDHFELKSWNENWRVLDTE